MSSVDISKETLDILKGISSRIGKSESQIVEDLIKSYDGAFWAGFEECLISKKRWQEEKKGKVTAKEITIHLPLPMLAATYAFLWEMAEGISVDRAGDEFILRAYLRDLDLEEIKGFVSGLARRYQLNPPPIYVEPKEEVHHMPFIIVPANFNIMASNAIPILLNPGTAFGKGDHPCTIYCLKAISDLYAGRFGKYLPRRILDAGTGTGILSIASVLLGAKEAIAVDISKDAVNAAKSNVILNHLEDRIKVIQCSISEVRGHFDLILANLYGMLLKDISCFLTGLLNKDGWLIIGGMIIPDDEIVISCYLKNGLKLIDTYRDEQWAVAILKKTNSN